MLLWKTEVDISQGKFLVCRLCRLLPDHLTTQEPLNGAREPWWRERNGAAAQMANTAVALVLTPLFNGGTSMKISVSPVVPPHLLLCFLPFQLVHCSPCASRGNFQNSTIPDF